MVKGDVKKVDDYAKGTTGKAFGNKSLRTEMKSQITVSTPQNPPHLHTAEVFAGSKAFAASSALTPARSKLAHMPAFSLPLRLHRT